MFFPSFFFQENAPSWASSRLPCYSGCTVVFRLPVPALSLLQFMFFKLFFTGLS